ncbi:MAG: glycosyltransferase [Muribaculum sp.]|nr:glycosyltransferase [Muribaculaceae bacterium]MCM1081168.1 glycosyltransferase [Muribaculum sp.]
MNQTANYRLTIVVPVYNEENNIASLEKELCAYLPKALCPTCVLFVNDGSKDRSLERIKEVCERNNDFYYISLAKNTGLSAAIKAGIDSTESQLVGYIDADLQTRPDDFNLLIPEMDSHELAVGIRSNRKDTGFKRLQSKIANGFRRIMTHDGATDTGCPLKIMRSDFAKRVPFFTGMHRFLPALIQLQGGRFVEIPVQHFPRMADQSKFNLRNRLVAPFIDCFAYRWMKKRYFNYSIGATDLTK